MEKRKVIVIGGGPAGYTAAMYLARAELKPLVFSGEKAGGQLMLTMEVENYPGFAEGIMGPKLMGEMRKQAEKFGAEMMDKNVTKVELGGETKKVWVGEEVFEAETVVVATGAKGRMLGMGEEKFLGRGVSTCAVCDAAFFKGKKVFVVGGGDSAMEDTLVLTKFASEIGVVHRRDSLRASKIMQEKVLKNEKVKVWWDSVVVGVKGEGVLKKVVIKNLKSGEEKEVEAGGLFLAIGHVPETKFFEGQLELDEKGFLKVELYEEGVKVEGYPMMTSVKGVFAAGDVVDFRYKQAVTAAGMGCQAALDVEKYLVKEK